MDFIRSGGDYSKQSPGAPIAYKLSYLGTNKPARLSFTTDYQLKDCERVSQKIKATLTYPMSTGRNFDEILRLLDSCQLTAATKVATPVNWNQGDDVIILPAVSDAEAKQKYPDGWRSPLPYIRVVPQPR